MLDKNYKVYVDAKILGRHDPLAPKKAFVAYVVKDEKRKRVKNVYAEETDDAECEAILFAIRRLKTKLKRFTIFCDHHSVVSEATKPSTHKPSRNNLINKIRRELNLNLNIKLKPFEKNPAHTHLNKYLQDKKKEQKNDTKRP